MEQSEVASYQSIVDCPLSFHPYLRSLQSLASARIAALLWRHKMDSLNKWDNPTLSWFHDQRFSCGDLLPVPSAIRDLIDRSIDRLEKQIESWARKYSQSIFPGCEDHVVIRKCIDCIEIFDDDEVIVSKLLVSKKLSPAEKYRLACKFFRKNDIERLWPLVSRNKRIIEVTFEDDDVLYYWNCTMKGITPQIPGHIEDSIDLRLISHQHPYNWQALEYFWDKLSIDERASIVTNAYEILIRSEGCVKLMLILLSKLNNLQILHVFDAIAFFIAEHIAMDVRNFEYLVQIWDFFCQFASTDRLFDVLREVYRIAFLPLFPPPLVFEEGFHVSEVLYELWIRSPKTLRSYVFDYGIEGFFDDMQDTIYVRLSLCYNRNMNFFLDLLAHVDLPERNRIWRCNWRSLMIRAKPVYLEQFMKLCFESDEEIVRFREDVMMDYDKIQSEAKRFADFGYFDELTEYVNFCSSDKQRVENLRRRIIASHFTDTSLFDGDNVLKFVKFVDDTFESAELAARFKEEFIMSPESEILIKIYDRLETGKLKNLIHLRLFLSSESCTNQVREECLKHFRNCLIKTTFENVDVPVWREFTMWCFASKREKWWEFRRSLPVTHIFDQLLNKVVKGINKLSISNNDVIERFERVKSLCKVVFTPLDNFLLWCYVNKDIVKNFKINTLKNGSSWVLTITMKKYWGKIVDIILEWIFDDDVKLLEEFKATWKPKEDTTDSTCEDTKT